MKFPAKKFRLFLLIILGIFVLALPLYIASKRYILYRNSLDYYISRSYGDLMRTSRANKELAQTILKNDKLQKYQALLFDKQFEDIIISLDGFANIANAIDKKNNYNTILTVVSHSPYGGNFTGFEGTDERQLNNDDKAFLNEVISIDNIIINAPPISTSDKSRVPYIKNDNWFNWFKQVYQNIIRQSSRFLKVNDASLSFAVTDENSRPLADAKIVIVNEYGDVIGTLTSDKDGHAEKKLTVPLDKRYFWGCPGFRFRGTVTAIAFKKGYCDTVLFEVPVSENSEGQPLHMKEKNEGSSNKPITELADNYSDARYFTRNYESFSEFFPSSSIMSNKSDTTTGEITFAASGQDYKPLSGVKILLIDSNGSVIDIIKTKNNGTAFAKLTVPIDKRYLGRGTVTAIAFKKGYRSAVIFQIPVNSSYRQPFFMNLNSSNTDYSDAVLGKNMDNDLNSLAAKYMPH